jgi:hypothetical protein
MMKETKQDEGEGSGSCLPDFRVDRLQDFSFERNKNKNKKRNARLFSAKPKMKKKRISESEKNNLHQGFK